MGTIEEDRTRIQLHSNEVAVTIVSILRELDEARAGRRGDCSPTDHTYDGRAAGAESDNQYTPAPSGVK